MELPHIYNLENQNLTLSLSDEFTGITYPFITVIKCEPDLFNLTFYPIYPIDKNYEGDHSVKLVLSDDLGASTDYFFIMKILPLINKGAPIFSQVPD
jgi:hypothetical protein